MLTELASHREPLWRLCYRMTGDAAEADDLVQETFRRALEKPPADTARDLRPWLMRVAVNLSRDTLRARKRHGYQGTWLPSPIETDSGFLLEQSGEARYGELESVTFAFLIALEALSATQRAVLLLRDVLDYSVNETAEALALSEANVKTTLHRARKAMADYDASAQRLTPERVHQTGEVLRALCLHLLAHNVPALEALLAHDVFARNDGAGEFVAAQKTVYGLATVIKFHLKVMQLRWKTSEGRAFGRLSFRSVNGLPALIADVPTDNARLPRRMVICIQLDSAGRIACIDTVVASEKLRALRFDDLPAPNVGVLRDVLRAGLLHPPARSWLRAAAQSLLNAGVERIRRLASFS